MKLRLLQKKDAERMMEWMHDPSVVEKLQTDFAGKSLDDCLNFISNSTEGNNFHLAITDDNDVYMGTVSLKHITDDDAEFAIAVHKDAMGHGYAIGAMKEMIRQGFEKYKIRSIYWCVAPDNYRALRFYDKNHFMRVNVWKLRVAGDYTEKQKEKYVWYQVRRS